MAALISSTPRRPRVFLLISVLVAFFLFHRTLETVFNILIAGPFIAVTASSHLRISESRDNFDITFKDYPQYLSSADINRTAPVPPIIHHILLGNPATSENVTKAREACVQYHPGYEFKYWRDDDAKRFVAEEYPELLHMWLRYRYIIQRADSLRYMILYKYGGIFLDLDLECRRPLEPLRQFSFVAPAATPQGISNGFLMVKPRHPFMKFVVENLPRYNLNWFGLPYAIVMFSTGCHYLSTMQSLFSQRSDLRVLWGPNNLHRLSGVVTTPLFNHLGLSSWHSADGAIFTIFREGHALSFLATKTFASLSIFALVGSIIFAARLRARRRLHHARRKGNALDEEKDWSA